MGSALGVVCKNLCHKERRSPLSAMGVTAVGDAQGGHARECSETPRSVRSLTAADELQDGHAREWSERTTIADRSCVICLRYSGHTNGFCSTCWSYVQSLRKPWERVMRDTSPEQLLEAVGREQAQRAAESRRRAAEDSAQILTTLDRVSHTLAMPPQMFHHFQKSLQSNEISPATLAQQMVSFGRPLITAKHAATLLAALRGRGETDNEYYHVLCSRVVDPWNLNNSDHSIGYCYYGSLADEGRQSLARLIGGSDRETLAAVFWNILRGKINFGEQGMAEWTVNEGHPCSSSHFWSDGDLSFIREEMLARGVAAAQSTIVTCECIMGSIRCTQVSGSEFATYEVPPGEDPFGEWLISQVSQALDSTEVGAQLCLVKTNGDIIVKENAPSVFQVVCGVRC